VFGPRNLRAGRERKVAGVPRSAGEVAPNVFVGEQWRGLAADVGIRSAWGCDGFLRPHGRWKRSDPRRADAPGVTGANRCGSRQRRLVRLDGVVQA